MILYCDVENCIYNEHGKCDAGKVEIVNGECEAFVKKESEVEYDAMCCEDCPCVNYCDGSMIEACMDDWRKRKQRESEVEHDA